MAEANYGLLGPADCAGVSGNGRLTIAFDAYGRLSMCRWPDPTAPNQITYTGSDGTARGAKWAIDDGDGVRWILSTNGSVTKMADGPAPVIEMRDPGTGVVQTAFVVAERDIAVFQIRFESQPPQNSVLWHADFSPCGSSMRAIPGSERLFPARADMVALYENAVYHARPNDAHSLAWEETNRWLTGGPIPEWFEKGAAVWIGYVSTAPFPHAVCSTREQDELGEGRTTRAVGQCYSVVRVPVDAATRTATVFVAFGERRDEVDELLAYAREQGYDRLLQATRAWWQERTEQSLSIPIANETLREIYAGALRQVMVSTDARTGAIARAATSDAPLFVDVPRHGVWATLALDLAGFSSIAETHLSFYANAVRADHSSSAQRGSLPAALYATGVDAAPDAILDVQATAWFLWSVWQHDAFLKDDERAETRKRFWEAVERGGDFISNWARAAHNTPPLSFEPALFRDLASLETFAVAYAGLRSATALAQAVGVDKEEWRTRVTEMGESLRYQALDSDGQFTIANPLALWPAEPVAAGDPRWDAAVNAALEQMDSLPPAEALKSLAFAAMVLRDQKDKLAKIEPLLLPVIQRALSAYPCDTYYASLALTTIVTTYSHGAY